MRNIQPQLKPISGDNTLTFDKGPPDPCDSMGNLLLTQPYSCPEVEHQNEFGGLPSLLGVGRSTNPERTLGRTLMSSLASSSILPVHSIQEASKAEGFLTSEPVAYIWVAATSVECRFLLSYPSLIRTQATSAIANHNDVVEHSSSSYKLQVSFSSYFGT